MPKTTSRTIKAMMKAIAPDVAPPLALIPGMTLSRSAQPLRLVPTKIAATTGSTAIAMPISTARTPRSGRIRRDSTDESPIEFREFGRRGSYS